MNLPLRHLPPADPDQKVQEDQATHLKDVKVTQTCQCVFRLSRKKRRTKKVTQGEKKI